MTAKNIHDRQWELKQLNIDQPFNNSQNIGDVTRKHRQLMRQWAVANRPEFGHNSIDAYCSYLTQIKFTV